MALYIDSLKARSFVALGSMSATFRVVIAGAVDVVELLGAAVVVVVAVVLLPQAAVASATPTTTSTNMAFLAKCLRIVLPFVYS